MTLAPQNGANGEKPPKPHKNGSAGVEFYPSPLRQPHRYLTVSLIAVRERMSDFGVPGAPSPEIAIIAELGELSRLEVVLDAVCFRAGRIADSDHRFGPRVLQAELELRIACRELRHYRRSIRGLSPILP